MLVKVNLRWQLLLNQLRFTVIIAGTEHLHQLVLGYLHQARHLGSECEASPPSGASVRKVKGERPRSESGARA